MVVRRSYSQRSPPSCVQANQPTWQGEYRDPVQGFRKDNNDDNTNDSNTNDNNANDNANNANVNDNTNVNNANNGNNNNVFSYN